MLGAVEKGYWKADQATIAQLSKALAESVAKNGAGCSSVICNTRSVQQFAVASLQTIPGGHSLAGNYLSGIQKQTQGITAAPSIIKQNAVSTSTRFSAMKQALHPSAPAGAVVQGNEIVTVYEKKISGAQIRETSSLHWKHYLFAGALFLLLLGIGWWRQGYTATIIYPVSN